MPIIVCLVYYPMVRSRKSIVRQQRGGLGTLTTSALTAMMSVCGVLVLGQGPCVATYSGFEDKDNCPHCIETQRLAPRIQGCVVLALTKT